MAFEKVAFPLSQFAVMANKNVFKAKGPLMMLDLRDPLFNFLLELPASGIFHHEKGH